MLFLPLFMFSQTTKPLFVSSQTTKPLFVSSQTTSRCLCSHKRQSRCLCPHKRQMLENQVLGILENRRYKKCQVLVIFTHFLKFDSLLAEFDYFC